MEEKSSATGSPVRKPESDSEVDKHSEDVSTKQKQDKEAEETKPATSAEDNAELKTIYNEYHETDDGLMLDPPRLSKSAHDSTYKRLRHSSIGPQLEVPKLKFPSAQMVLTVMAFFGFLNIYCLRVDLSVAIVAMVNYTALAKSHNGSAYCGDASPGQKKEDGPFVWDPNEQGVALSSFYYGYIFTNVIGGTLAQKVGGKYVLLFGIFWTSVLTLLTPICTEKGGFGALLAVRVLEGVGEGVTYPAMHVLISRWAAPAQRSRMATAVYAGAQIGAVITMPISGALASLSSIGWHYIFYFFGALGCLWSILWIFLIYDTPEKHPRIEEAELKFIQASLAGISGKQTLKVPWKAIATSLPVYAAAIGHFTNNWGYYTLINALPSYMKTILGFDMKENGILSGIPYLLAWVCMTGGGQLADLFRTRFGMSTTLVRKLFNAIGFIFPAVLLIATGLVGCNKAAAVTLVTLGIGFTGFSMAGWGVNHLDLAPPYAGTLMGITNTLATIPGIVCMSVVGLFTNNNQTVTAWQHIFYLCAAVYVFGTIFFIIFGSGRRQAWASPVDQSSETEKK